MQGRLYSPGPGRRPPLLAGRDAFVTDWQLQLNEVAADGRNAADDWLLLGPRGVGKTVLLAELGRLAEADGYDLLAFQAVAHGEGLMASLAAQAADRLDKEPLWERLTGWLGGFEVGVAGTRFGLDLNHGRTAPREYPRDARMLAKRLTEVADAIRKDRRRGGVLITLDEIQVADPADLALLAAVLQQASIHHGASPLLFAGSGLPHTFASLKAAGVTHPDRLFRVETLPVALDDPDAKLALVGPAQARGVHWEPAALERALAFTQGYPAHLQLLAAEAWRRAPGPDQLALADVEAAIPTVAQRLETATLEPRWDELSDRAREYLMAVELCGPEARTADVAAVLDKTQKQLSGVRADLIREGDLVAARHGRIQFASPLFAQYVRARYEHLGDDVVPLERMRARLRALRGEDAEAIDAAPGQVDSAAADRSTAAGASTTAPTDAGAGTTGTPSTTTDAAPSRAPGRIADEGRTADGLADDEPAVEPPTGPSSPQA